MTNSNILTKYRPTTFDEVVGQEVAIKSLKAAIAKRSNHAFIFTGPSGTGKTTLARIAAKELGCVPQSLMEIDAASNSGVDAMREIVRSMQYAGFGKDAARVVIIDEAHALSAAAWQVTLKATEDAPKNAFWFFCTTEPGKIPKTVKARCATYEMKEVSTRKLEELLLHIRDSEGFVTTDKVVSFIAKKSNGSPRFAINYLSVCSECKSTKSAAKLLNEVSDKNDPTIALCRELLNGIDWARAMELAKELKGTNPESVRIVLCNYMASVAAGAKSVERAARPLAILQAFAEPYPTQGGFYNILLSLGELFMD